MINYLKQLFFENRFSYFDIIIVLLAWTLGLTYGIAIGFAIWFIGIIISAFVQRHLGYWS